MAAFDDRIADAAAFLDSFSTTITVVAHLDSDGLCAAAIFERLLERAGRAVRVEVLTHVSHAALGALPDVPTVFVDTGASHLATLARRVSPTLIVDHHLPADVLLPKNFLMLNPLLDGLDGGREACSASVAYALAVQVDPRNRDLAPLAVVGIIADSQEKGGIIGLNSWAVADAEAAGLLRIERGLRLFGRETRSVAQLLAQSYDLKIPGVTGDLRGAKELLAALGIEERFPGRRGPDAWRKWHDLSREEQRRIEDDIVRRRGSQEGLFAQQFTLLAEPPGPTRDARQFATLLNACGRLEHGALGLGLARGDAAARARAADVLAEYKETLNRAMRWFEGARGSPAVREGPGFVLIDAQQQVLPAIAGTLCSMLVRGDMVPRGTVVVALARFGDGMTKISMRCVGGADVQKLLSRLVARFDGESGGHYTAAGGIIPQEYERAFLDAVQVELQ